MKYIISLFFFFNFSNAQVFKGVILDSITKLPIEMASVTLNHAKSGTLSNVNGEFNIALISKNDYLVVSFLGYNEKIIIPDLNSKAKNIFYLSVKNNQLDEVFIYTKKVKYTSDKFITSDNKNLHYFSFQFGTEVSRYIENANHKKGKIKAIVLSLDKVKNFVKPCKLCKVDYLVSFNLKFYQYNTTSKMPGELLHYQDIIISPENKTQKLKLDLDSLSIPFPESGVYVALEIVNTKYTNPKKAGAFTAPSIGFTESENNKTIFTRVKTDKNSKPTLLQRPSKKSNTHEILALDLVINYEK